MAPETRRRASRRGPNGGYLREVDQRDRWRTSSTPTLPKETLASKLVHEKDLMLAEFARRDFSTVLDEGAGPPRGSHAISWGRPPRSTAAGLAQNQWTSAPPEAARCGNISRRSRPKKPIYSHPEDRRARSAQRDAEHLRERPMRNGVCALSFKELDDRSSRFRSARSCHLVSGGDGRLGVEAAALEKTSALSEPQGAGPCDAGRAPSRRGRPH